jgi:hypothetical protein
MSLQDDLLAIDKGFWLEDEEFFLNHVDEKCALVFAQMQGVYPKADVAASAHDPKRWQDLKISSPFLLQPTEGVAFLSYTASVRRADGKPYKALIGSLYLRRDDGWKLAAHQHSPLDEPENG